MPPCRTADNLLPPPEQTPSLLLSLILLARSAEKCRQMRAACSWGPRSASLGFALLLLLPPGFNTRKKGTGEKGEEALPAPPQS